MGPVRVLNPKGKWKEVAIDPNLYANAEMANFVSFEEMTDYELVDGKPLEILGKKKKKKKGINGSEDGAENDTKAAKKKKNKKQKAKSANESGSSDIEGNALQEPEQSQDTAGKKKKQKLKKQKLTDTDPATSSSVGGDKKSRKDIKLKGRKGKLVSMGNVVDILSSEDIQMSDPLGYNSHEDASDETKEGTSVNKKRKITKSLDEEDDAPQKKKKKQNKTPQKDVKANTKGSSALPDMSSWKDLFVPEPVLRALAEEGFTAPMPIQALTLPSACRDRKDIVGAAETGSGKTLAFGIPLLYNILKSKENQAKAQQSATVDSGEGEAKEDLDNLQKEDAEDPGDEEEETAEDEEESDDEEGDEELSQSDEEEQGTPDSGEEDLSELEDNEMGCVRAVNNVKFDWLEEESTGSKMAEKDGSKKLSKGLKPLFALVLTPTRELAIQVCNHINRAAKYTGIKAAVVVGGMAPQKQRRILKKCPEIVVATPGRLWELIREDVPHLAKVTDIKYLVIDEADRMIEKGHFAELQGLLELINKDEEKKRKRQTFVFSATLTMVHSGPNRILKKKKKKKQMTSEAKLENLMDSVGIKPKPKIVDLTNKIGMAEKVVESRIHSSVEEKDLYLYYLLQQYPGRTLVFCNSKDCVRRLVSVFTLLECKPLPLHADMHQRQRLKNLDKFRDNPRSLLLATDVAARGLDIPGVEHVVHYQVPRTSENYVHRSGRTARGYSEGLSVILVGPDELKSYRKILHTLKREDDLPMFPVEEQYLPQLKDRVNLARSIDKSEHRMNKMKVENNWFEKAAQEMDMVLDEDFLLNDLGDSHAQAGRKKAMSAMRAELKGMLSQAVIPRYFSGKYPTMSGKLFIPYMKDRNVDGAVNKVKDVRKTQPKNVVNVMKQKKKKQRKRK